MPLSDPACVPLAPQPPELVAGSAEWSCVSAALADGSRAGAGCVGNDHAAAGVAEQPPARLEPVLPALPTGVMEDRLPGRGEETNPRLTEPDGPSDERSKSGASR
jgi:hypothetical protein